MISSFLDCGGGEAADSAGLAVGFEVGNDVNLEVEIGVDLGVSTVDSGVGADDALWVGDGACAGVGFGVELGARDDFHLLAAFQKKLSQPFLVVGRLGKAAERTHENQEQKRRNDETTNSRSESFGP